MTGISINHIESDDALGKDEHIISPRQRELLALHGMYRIESGPPDGAWLDQKRHAMQNHADISSRFTLYSPEAQKTARKTLEMLEEQYGIEP